jgi:hypothetical protein
MPVQIAPILNKQAYDDHMEAQQRAYTVQKAHLQAERDAFMALMSEIGVGIGDKVTIKSVGSFSTNGTAILTGPKLFSKIKKDGTASLREFHVYGEYTVEKFTPTPE